MAGFTGVLKPGSMADELDSKPDPSPPSALEEDANFGVGASGFVFSMAFAPAAGARDFSSVAGEVSGISGVSAEIEVQQRNKSAVIIKDHLSHCRARGERAEAAATISTLLYQRTGVTGPLVMFLVVLLFTSHAISF